MRQIGIDERLKEIAYRLQSLAGEILSNTVRKELRCGLCYSLYYVLPSEHKRISKTKAGLTGFICSNCKTCLKNFKRLASDGTK